ncbi:MAG: carbohydrate ABC transporter permease [Solirubrobacteraceae bacterium]|jgi:ABC-type glycerol-3-phosphate transport system permease component
MRLSRRTLKAVRIFFATAVGIVLAGPLIYLIAGSLMSSAQVDAATPQFIPSSFHFDDYVQGWNQVLQARTFLNSVIFVVFAVGIQWALCISGGLAITKMRFRGRTAITAMFAVSLFIPVVTTVIPVFVVTNQFGLINTYPGLIIPIAAQTGFGTLLFRQYIVTMPQELFDAARMDGAGWWLLLRRLVVPLARPATAAYLAISVITAWNMYLWPLLAANAPHVETLSEIVAAIGQGDNFGYNVSVPAQFAATVITVVPMVIAFLLVQPAFVRGLTGSGVE